MDRSSYAGQKYTRMAKPLSLFLYIISLTLLSHISRINIIPAFLPTPTFFLSLFFAEYLVGGWRKYNIYYFFNLIIYILINGWRCRSNSIKKKDN